MKFSIGDYVSYTQKRYGIDVKGEIIAIYHEPGWDTCYYVKGNERSLGFCGRKTMSSDHIFTTINEQEFRARGGMFAGLESISEYVFTVPGRSRNLRSLELKYDPEQQGDEDDDL